MIVYAIKHITNGYFPLGKGNRAHTFAKPSYTKAPRIFAQKRYATAAMKAWLKGEWHG